MLRRQGLNQQDLQKHDFITHNLQILPTREMRQAGKWRNFFYRFTGTQNTARKDDSREPAGMIGFTAQILFDIQYAAV